MAKKDDGELRRGLGISRRDLLKRGAVVGGTLVWAAPAIQSLTTPAYGQTRGTPRPCAACYCFTGNINNPSKDECSDDGPVAHRADAASCDAWCKHQAPFTGAAGAPGGPYTQSRYCTANRFCDCNTESDPGTNGVVCN